MTDTQTAPTQVDLSIEENGISDDDSGVPAHWASSTTMLEPPVVTEAPTGAGGDAPPSPPPADPRPEKQRFLVRLGHIFSGGPNGF